MSGIVIQTWGIGKRYRKHAGGMHQRLEILFRAPYYWLSRERKKAATRDLYSQALQDISVTIRGGESVGLIGPNGAGKSALLRVLAGVTRPSEGCAEIRGRVSSMLEAGTGFHPELTGRENIFLSGAILGLKKKEIEKKFDEIVQYSELESFLNTPVKHFSSGMRVRLAFAIAAQLQSDIMLVDEVLSIGDLRFKEKCVLKLREMIAAGCTLVLVSHDAGVIESLCPRTLLLHQGRLLMDDATKTVLRYYSAQFRLSAAV